MALIQVSELLPFMQNKPSGKYGIDLEHVVLLWGGTLILKRISARVYVMLLTGRPAKLPSRN